MEETEDQGSLNQGLLLNFSALFSAVKTFLPFKALFNEGTTGEKPVSFNQGLILINLAILFDAIQSIFSLSDLIPFIGWVVAAVFHLVISLTAFITFAMFLSATGYSIWNLNRGGSMIAVFLISLIPLPLPEWIAWVSGFILTNQVSQITKQAD